MNTPDHVENTGDNLRHAAEVTQKPKSDDDQETPEDVVSANPPPDFNT